MLYFYFRGGQVVKISVDRWFELCEIAKREEADKQLFLLEELK